MLAVWPLREESELLPVPWVLWLTLLHSSIFLGYDSVNTGGSRPTIPMQFLQCGEEKPVQDSSLFFPSPFPLPTTLLIVTTPCPLSSPLTSGRDGLHSCHQLLLLQDTRVFLEMSAYLVVPVLCTPLEMSKPLHIWAGMV